VWAYSDLCDELWQLGCWQTRRTAVYTVCDSGSVMVALKVWRSAYWRLSYSLRCLYSVLSTSGAGMPCFVYRAFPSASASASVVRRMTPLYIAIASLSVCPFVSHSCTSSLVRTIQNTNTGICFSPCSKTIIRVCFDKRNSWSLVQGWGTHPDESKNFDQWYAVVARKRCAIGLRLLR